MRVDQAGRSDESHSLSLRISSSTGDPNAGTTVTIASPSTARQVYYVDKTVKPNVPYYYVVTTVMTTPLLMWLMPGTELEAYIRTAGSGGTGAPD